MKFPSDHPRLAPFAAGAALLLSLAGCQSGGGGGLLNLGIGGKKEAVAEEKVEQVDLTAYCPRVGLREGTAYFNTYQKPKQGEPEQDRSLIIYQASITEVTRNCRYEDGQLRMTIAVAGKVVPGPKAKAGAVTMPIRIAVLRGDEVLYSQLHRHSVEIAATAGATQYVFSDPAVVFPAPTERNIQVFAGFDEGPYDTP
jgi:hypothetical protein